MPAFSSFLPTRTSFTGAVVVLVVVSALQLPLASALAMTTPQVAQQMEQVVSRYFQGVNDKNPDMIASCFGDSARIRDVCALQQRPHSNDNDDTAAETKTVSSSTLVDRCMDFVTAHPDCRVQFHYGPECGRSSAWVVAHWYETGTWSGRSCGIEPNHQPMAVEGQTRFLVDPKTLLIRELVVTRTFTEWEKALLQLQQAVERKK